MIGHMYVAIRRKKENVLEKQVHRYIGTADEKQDITSLKSIICGQGGLWRIYRSVNRRDFEIAQKELIKTLIDNPIKYQDSVSSKWKSILMMPQCRAKDDKFWLVDIDVKDEVVRDNIIAHINYYGNSIYLNKETPNGYHLVTNRFDTRKFLYKNVEIKKDDLVLLELYDDDIGISTYDV
jgi:hypothetical protein